MDKGSIPAKITSRRRVVYRETSWSVRHWAVVGGAGSVVCRVAAIRMKDSLLLWIAPPEAKEELQWMVVAVAAGNGRRNAVGTTLLGDDTSVEPGAGLARRLSAALSVPVWLSGATAPEPRTLPVLEQALVTELRLWLKGS